jgi:hypothetical protein
VELGALDGARGSVRFAHAHPAYDDEQVRGGQQRAEAAEGHAGEERGPVQSGGGLVRAEQGEHLAPESGQSGQSERGDGAEGEKSAEARNGAVEGAAGAPRKGVEVGAAGAFLEASDQEEQQAGDQSVGDVGEQRAVDAGGGHRRDAEQDEAHVSHGRVRDQPLQVAARAAAGEGEAGERTVDDAGGGEDGEIRGERVQPVRCDGQQDADEAVGPHLQQDAREQDGAHRRGGGVRVGQPAVQGPHRGLHGEPDADGESGDELGRSGQGGVIVSGECHHVESAGPDADEQQAEQHHDRAQQRVQDELPGGGGALRASAPVGDEEVHRDEHGLEGEEEEEEVERGERGEHACFEEQEQRDERLGAAEARGVGSVPVPVRTVRVFRAVRAVGAGRAVRVLLADIPGGRGPRTGAVAVERAEEREQGRQDEQGQGDAVDAQVEVGAEGGDPLHVGFGLHGAGTFGVEAQSEDDCRGEHGPGDGDAVAEHGLLRAAALEAGRGRQERGGGAEQRQHEDGDEERLHDGVAEGDHGQAPPVPAATRTTATVSSREPTASAPR